uniref:DNA-directed RNA polymerase subunit beta n=1 Tax=Davidia involucrata TaxID=16924 RepID=A0A5B7ANF1_DAVIN
MGASDAMEDPGTSSKDEKLQNGEAYMDLDDLFEDPGTSSKGEKLQNGTADMDLDDDDDVDDDLMDSKAAIQDLGEDFLRNFCRKASVSFFEQYGLISHQLNSYNDFIKHGIKNVFNSIGEIIVQPGYDPSKKGENEWKYASVKFGEVTLERPRFWTGEKFSADSGKEFLDLLPRHARLQNMTYSSRMKVQINVQVYTQKLVRSDKFKTGKEQYLHKEVISEDNRDVIIGRIPVMLKSDLCWMNGVEKGDCDFDHGGYFLIKGAEKTFIAQEQTCLRRLWLSNSPTWAVAYRSIAKRKRVYMKLVDTPKVEHIRGGEKVITVYFSVTEIPIWILFFALGVSSDREVVNLIDSNIEDASIINILVASIHDADKKCEDFRKGGKALNHLDKLIKNCRFPPAESVEDCINNYLFPSLIGFKRKARFLGYMVKCLLQAYTGRRKVDNRDDFRNKRLDLAGELLERELRVHIKHAERRMVKAMQRDLYGDRSLHPIEHYLDASIITNGLSRAFSTGGWSHPYKKMERTSGVVATLRRTNPLQTTADMRKTRQQVQYTGKVGDARYPHPSHWGKVCFLSTPDGENCGLVKNFAITGRVSTNVLEPLVDKLFDSGMEQLLNDSSTSLCGKDKIFLDGDWVGICEDSFSFVAELRSKRRRKEVPHQVEIKRDEQNGEVRIFSDAGRILRPLLVVENLRKIKALKSGDYTFQSLLDNGIIELIGAEEEEDCCTAWGIKYLLMENEGNPFTHCELDMSFLLGLSCGIIPFANHDHARRVLYQSEKHSQQAIGFSTTNPNIRVDTLTHQLYYPQRPLFRTMLSDCLGKPGYPLGQNGILPKPEYFNGQCAIVAVNVHLGYNQEDSLVMNRASLERGMFRSEHIRSYKAEVDNKEALGKKAKFDDAVNFGKIQSKIGRVDSLDDDGFPFIGANLQNGDIVIGRCAESGTDHSIKLKHTERGMVQKVVLSANDDGKNFAVVSLRQVRSPCLGDKFSSMHGQKGVLGFLESQENFPFTIQGIVPDIVINPHAFPSRQTPGQLLEAALGKGIACGGSQRYATPFSALSVDAITDQLHRAGFSRWGNERVYNGRTGEMIRSLVFMGPTFYQRLTHMAEDKVKFRNTGPVHPLTRQPVADRKRFGGIKFGEMERDCLIAHGASANLHERLFTLSDSSQMHICQKCKNIANVIQRPVPGGRKIRGPYCRFCESVEEIVRVNVPYGAKLLCQELFSMGISLKFETELC